MRCSDFWLSFRNLPFKISADEMYDIFGKYGAIRQVRSVMESNHDMLHHVPPCTVLYHSIPTQKQT